MADSNNNEKGRIKISFGMMNSAKKVDFSSMKLPNSEGSAKPQFQPRQTFQQPVSQFKKVQFDFNKPAPKREENVAKQETKPAPAPQPQKTQFRKMSFDFSAANKVEEKPAPQENKPAQEKRDLKPERKPFDRGGFRESNRFAAQAQQQREGQRDGGFNKQFGDKKFGDNRFGGNNGGNKPGFKKPFTFVKKNNQVKVKLANKPNNDTRQVYKKTANTGGNVDKYSIHSMMRSVASNIDIDTEIDDVLGNVINVKPAGINSSFSFQHERKVRSGKGDKKTAINLPISREIEIYNDEISLASLADQMSVSVRDLVRIIENEGVNLEEYAEQDEYGGRIDYGKIVIDGDTAELVASNCGHSIVRSSEADAENEFVENISNGRKDLRPRAPIVTIMGHVDHGKTTLLDYIRKASVASGEAGGITQHIGAYRTKVGDKWITFLDTPGHAAFTQMRMRGAQATDICVIVIAADDGIMPQTIEAINHAKAAGCPIIIAINKIDKPEANIERAKNMLLQYEVVPEELGGDVMVVPISAMKGTNVDKLLEAILLQAEMLELKAYYDGGSDGVVVESKLDKKRGTLVTVIVKNGILSQGDFLIAGEQYGKIKGMFDENGKMLKTAEPSVPVEILGMNSTPDAGEIFYAVKKEADAKEMIEYRKEKARQDELNAKAGLSAADAFARMQGDNGEKKVSFIIKADTKGSLEAIVGTLEKMEGEELELRIAHTGIGAVNESDVLLAGTCGGRIFTFNTQKCDKKVLDEAERRGVEIRDYKIIYELFDDVKDILSGKLKPIIKKTVVGHAEVKAIFEISKVGKIAGCLVKDGKAMIGTNVAVMRNGEAVFETKCDSLKHGKESVKEMQSGQECGVGLEKIDELKVGYMLEFFTVKEDKK